LFLIDFSFSNDAFVIDSSTGVERIIVYLFDGEEFKFVRNDAISTSDLANVVNVAAADFNFDGRLDLLVTSATAPNAADYELRIYLQNDAFGYAPVYVDAVHAVSQVTIIDYNFDLRPDLIGMSVSTNASSPGNKLTVWVNDNTTEFALRV
jgi:integrin alpha FG-GAP repeat containing protein 1